MDPGREHSVEDLGVWALVEAQYGVISQSQLTARGFGRDAIRHRVARGRLHPVMRGVYAVGRARISRRGLWMSAVLAAGRQAALSHTSAGALWGVANEGRQIEVSVRTCQEVGKGWGVRGRVRVHRRAGLRNDDLTVRDGIPVTAPARTLVDLAALSGRDRIERMVNEADRLDLIDPESLRASLPRFRGERGVARLREALDRRTFRFTRSRLERAFLRLSADAGLPLPLTRQWVNGFEVDFFWPELELVVETDGARYHRTPERQARDRLRDQTHTLAGLTQLRFTEGQIRFEPRRVAATLRAVTARLPK